MFELCITACFIKPRDHISLSLNMKLHICWHWLLFAIWDSSSITSFMYKKVWKYNTNIIKLLQIDKEWHQFSIILNMSTFCFYIVLPGFFGHSKYCFLYDFLIKCSLSFWPRLMFSYFINVFQQFSMWSHCCSNGLKLELDSQCLNCLL